MSQDNAEFAEFFAASWDPCLRAVAASTGSMTLAEDQVAEAFARAWASWRKVSHHPAPRAWVVRTALNAGASAWHRRSRETALASQDIAARRCTSLAGWSCGPVWSSPWPPGRWPRCSPSA